MQEAASCEIREDQDRKADPLGDRRGQRGTGSTHIQREDKDGVQDAAEDTAKAHTDHT